MKSTRVPWLAVLSLVVGLILAAIQIRAFVYPGVISGKLAGAAIGLTLLGAIWLYHWYDDVQWDESITSSPSEPNPFDPGGPFDISTLDDDDV